jgi:hypothetical protein
VLKTSFFRQLRELKIQRKNLDSALRVEVEPKLKLEVLHKSKEPPNASKYTPCSIDIFKNSPLLLTLPINIFGEFSHGNPQIVDCVKFFFEENTQ